jgi:formate dehydrogenase iron-sulfur subunit
MEGNKISGIGVMNKCTVSLDRLANGQPPACVAACPTGALVFGNRDELVVSGKQRVRDLQKKYPAAYLYGEKELGGLHVLYVLDDRPEKYDLPVQPQAPLAASVWQSAIQPLGLAMLGLTAAGLGLNYIVSRATINAREETGRAWVCPTCGYIYHGDEPPSKCPVSGDSRSSFRKVEE